MGQTAEREQRYKDATVPQRMNLLYSHETWDREEPQDWAQVIPRRCVTREGWWCFLGRKEDKRLKRRKSGNLKKAMSPVSRNTEPEQWSRACDGQFGKDWGDEKEGGKFGAVYLQKSLWYMERTGSESILKEKGDGRAISSQYRGGVMTVVRRIECEERRNQKQTNEKILSVPLLEHRAGCRQQQKGLHWQPGEEAEGVSTSSQNSEPDRSKETGKGLG